MNSLRVIRVVALFGPTAAALILLAAGPLQAYPGAVTQSAPVAGPKLTKTASVPSGSYSVSSRTGAAQYSFPIELPEGRSGLTPSLSLSYTSQGALRGGVAAGWSLSIPQIRVDTSRGRVGGTHYISTLAGGQRLVAVDEPGAYPDVDTYRVAENDGSYTRYEHSGDHPGVWRAMTTGGLTYRFGDDVLARDEATAGGSGAEARWFVTHITDRLGNDVWFQ